MKILDANSKAKVVRESYEEGCTVISMAKKYLDIVLQWFDTQGFMADRGRSLSDILLLISNFRTLFIRVKFLWNKSQIALQLLQPRRQPRLTYHMLSYTSDDSSDSILLPKVGHV